MIKAASGKLLRINMAAYRGLCDVEVALASRSPWTAEECQHMKQLLDAVLTQMQGRPLDNHQKRLLEQSYRHGRYISIR